MTPRTARYLLLWLLLILVIALPGQAFAQGITPTLPSLPSLDFNSLIQQTLQFSGGLLASFLTAPATIAIVALLKRLPPLKNVAGKTITTATSVVLMAILAIAIKAGVEPQFRNLLDTLTPILTILAGTSVNLLAATTGYQAAAAQSVPLIGHQRSVPDSTANILPNADFPSVDALANLKPIVATSLADTPGLTFTLDDLADKVAAKVLSHLEAHDAITDAPAPPTPAPPSTP